MKNTKKNFLASIFILSLYNVAASSCNDPLLNTVPQFSLINTYSVKNIHSLRGNHIFFRFSQTSRQDKIFGFVRENKSEKKSVIYKKTYHFFGKNNPYFVKKTSKTMTEDCFRFFSTFAVYDIK